MSRLVLLRISNLSNNGKMAHMLCSSLGMLLGYHLLWSWTANVVGTDEQKDRAQKNIIENNYFIGGMTRLFQLGLSTC